MQNFSVSPASIISSFWKNFSLVKVLVKREVIGRYRGSFMGILWSFFNPLFMLAVYTFVFGVIFKSKWNTESSSQTEFALVLFAGLIVFNLFAESINRAPMLILSNVNYVKKVVFPLEILPIVSLGSALFHSSVSWVVWLSAYCIFFGIPHATVMLLPIVVLPLIFFILGISWWLASLGVYLRDVSQFVGIIVTVLMFLSPIFYPASALPEGAFRSILSLNPLTNVVEQVREVMFWGKLPDISRTLFTLTVSIAVAVLGFVWFQKTRKGFADVI